MEEKYIIPGAAYSRNGIKKTRNFILRMHINIDVELHYR